MHHPLQSVAMAGKQVPERIFIAPGCPVKQVPVFARITDHRNAHTNLNANGRESSLCGRDFLPDKAEERDALGRERTRMLTIHHGRHTFISHALAGGRTLGEVRVAAGHASLVTTSVYLHIAVDDDG
jgi:integrase